MVKRTIYLVSLIGLSFLTITSCDEDNSNEPESRLAKTPYNLIMPTNMPPPILPEDNPLTVEGVALGRELFYEKLLSKDNSQSCGSCHAQKDAFTDNKKAFSVGVRGELGGRNSMPIFNLFYHQKGFFWDGRAEILRHQSLLPIEDELEMDETLENVVLKLSETEKYPLMFNEAFGDNEITTERMSLAMEQFMFTLVSGDSKFDKVERGELEFTASEQRGMELFFAEFDPNSSSRGADCFHCHGGADFSNHEFMNNGLDSDEDFTDLGRANVTKRQSDNAKFKTPSLRNIALSGPYMHDGRFSTLKEVIEHYNSGVKESTTLDVNMHTIKEGMNLTEIEKADLIAFLHTLTDDKYINNPEYANPNK